MFNRAALFALLALASCTSAVPLDPWSNDPGPQPLDDPTTGDDDDDDDSALGDDDDSASDDDDSAETPPADDPIDPFAARPDSTEGLINTSFDLEQLLEFGSLQGACDAYHQDPTNRRLKLLCGKRMFFYEGFGTLGIPEPLMDWMSRNFPDEAGLAFTNYGLIQDPYESTPEQPRHLGIGPGAMQGSTQTLALTCANCHFGKMPDGRYAVGYPNLQYEYGTHMLSLFLGPMKGMPGFDPSTYHPDAITAVQPILDRFDADPFLSLGLAWNMLPMLGGLANMPTLSWDEQGHYASWAPGNMDFTMAPLPIEDNVHTVSRILPLWGIPTVAEEEDYELDSAMLAWTGSAHSLNQFLEGFVVIGGGPVEDWGPDELAPLREYIESLDAPLTLNAPPASEVEAGRVLFTSTGCIDCHGGPRGGGTQIFDFDEIGTDPALADWGDADGDGVMCCGVEAELTGGVKAPRLTGAHALNRYLHNGSLTSLEQLLCLDQRPPSNQPPYANTGHEYGCGLSTTKRHQLLHFIRSL